MNKRLNSLQLDGNAKHIFLQKPLLASVLKRVIVRYANMATQEIIPLLDPSHAGKRIIGLSGELRSGGAPIRLDSLFEAVDPEGGRCLVNLEFQGSYEEYPLVNRGIFYLAVILANEKDVFFSNDDYRGVCPVHGIWIVFNSPVEARGKWNHYAFQSVQQNDTHVSEDVNHWLMELDVFNLGLGTPQAYNGNTLMEILSLLFEGNLTLEERQEALRKYEIELDEEELEEMGSLVTEYGLYREMKGEQKGFANGEKQGFANGEKQGFANGEKQGFANGEKQGFANGHADCIRRLSRSFPPERIAEMIQLPLEEVKSCLA